MIYKMKTYKDQPSSKHYYQQEEDVYDFPHDAKDLITSKAPLCSKSTSLKLKTNNLYEEKSAHRQLMDMIEYDLQDLRALNDEENPTNFASIKYKWQVLFFGVSPIY